MGFVAAVIWNSLSDKTSVTVIDTLLVFFVCAIMKKLFVTCGIRADLLETKTMLGNYLIYLTLALGACILFINPPFF